MSSSPCLTGGAGRAYGFELDLVKSPSRSSHSSSSTLSESSNSTPLAISTKRARTSRKRPNQTYTEAAALLANVYPTIFSTKQLTKHCRLATRHPDSLLDSSSELLPPFPGLAGAGFLLRDPVQDSPNSLFEPFSLSSNPKSCWIPPGIASQEFTESQLTDEFDAESILDEEIGEGIDTIMGGKHNGGELEQSQQNDYGSLVNPYLGQLVNVVNVTRALRHVGNGDWWSSPTVEIKKIVPELRPSVPEKSKSKKKKKKKVEKEERDVEVSSSSAASCAGKRRPALGLKLDCDGVIKEWSGQGSPFSDVPGSSESPADIIAKLSDIDLLSEVAGSGGLREASVLRYKEKRRSRLFSKKVRYQVRKVNADKRPRMKGRFVKRDDEQ